MAVLAHTLIHSAEMKIDMRCVCPRDVKKMLVQRARSVYWKKWAAKHEDEELKEGTWFDPALVLLRKKAKGAWTERHRNVARMIFLEGGWTQKRLFENGWWDISKCQACQMEEGTVPLSGMARSKAGYSGILQKVGAKGENVEERMEAAKRHSVAHPLSGRQWNGGHISATKCESEKHGSWSMPVEGFKGHVATDASLLGKTGRWGACGWAVVQRGSVEAETRGPAHHQEERADGFLCLIKRVIGPIKVHVDNKGIIDGLRKGESMCIKPSEREMLILWIQVWERITWSGRKRHFARSGACKGASHQKRKRNICRSLRGSSPKVTRRLMSWQKQEQCWTKDLWQKRKQKRCSRKWRRCMQLCSMRPASTAW